MQSMSEYCETELKKLYFNRKYSVGYGAGLVKGVFLMKVFRLYTGLYWSLLARREKQEEREWPTSGHS